MTFRWKIWYGDGATANDRDHRPEEVPERNVQIIAVSDEEIGWYSCKASDYYWYLPETDTWSCGDIFGLWDYLCSPGWKRVLMGRSLGNAEYNAIVQMAQNDPEVPKKAGWRPDEYRPKE